MTDMSSTGRSGEVELVAHLNELRELAGELRHDLPHVNDLQLRPAISSLVDTAHALLDAHGHDPKPSIADDLSVLMSAIRALKIPPRDPDLGRTPTLERLRKSKGLIVAELADALDSAASIGLVPQKPPIPIDIAASLPRSEVEGLLQGIQNRLSQVEKSLDALDEARALPSSFNQQNGLLNFYVSSMRVEVDLAKLHLTVADKTVDFGALARAAETMSDLTRGFAVTVREWSGRVKREVIQIATEMPKTGPKSCCRGKGIGQLGCAHRAPPRCFARVLSSVQRRHQGFGRASRSAGKCDRPCSGDDPYRREASKRACIAYL